MNHSNMPDLKLHVDKEVPFNPLPNDNFLDWAKFKAFADDNSNVAKITIFVCDRLEKIVEKGENAGYQHFLFFPQSFQKTSFSGWLKSGFCGKDSKTYSHH